MNTLFNLIWFVFGGFIVAIEYFFASLMMMITIIGIPFGIQTMKLAGMALWPFGKEVKDSGKGSESLQTVMNILWLIFGGIPIVITHAILGVVFFVTIVGIPFSKQHFKLAGIALTPFGKEVV